jgi:hypothetical protein
MSTDVISAGEDPPLPNFRIISELVTVLQARFAMVVPTKPSQYNGRVITCP